MMAISAHGSQRRLVRLPVGERICLIAATVFGVIVPTGVALLVLWSIID